MNCRRIAAFFCLLTCVQLLGLRSARAGELPANVLTTTNGASVTSAVTAFVNKHVANLGSTDAEQRRAAREALIGELAAGANQVQPSPQFLAVYAAALDTALQPLATNPDVRVRLNAAVTASSVAEKSRNTGLIPVVVKLLSDDSEAVVLWAAKAGKSLLPPVLRQKPANDPLLPALLAAGKKYVNSGPMSQTVYEALRNNDEAILTPPPGWAAMAPTIVDSLQDLLAQRLELYKQGIPEQPMNEAGAIYFLTAQNVWKVQTPAEQLQTVQFCSDLIALAGQQLDNAQGFEKNDLIDLLSRTSGALQVVGDLMNKGSAMGSAIALGKINATSGIDSIKAAVDAVYPSLVRISEFSTLKPPPKIQ